MLCNGERPWVNRIRKNVTHVLASEADWPNKSHNNCCFRWSHQYFINLTGSIERRCHKFSYMQNFSRDTIINWCWTKTRCSVSCKFYCWHLFSVFQLNEGVRSDKSFEEIQLSSRGFLVVCTLISPFRWFSKHFGFNVWNILCNKRVSTGLQHLSRVKTIENWKALPENSGKSQGASDNEI